MDYIIYGKQNLKGELSVYGAKNCVLALLGATPLTDDTVVLKNCPQILDVDNMLLLLQALGKCVKRQDDTICVSGSISSTNVSAEIAKLLRGSGLLLGSLLSRYGNAFLPITGGCAIGKRPMDIHIDGLRAMGVSVVEDTNGILCEGTPVGCVYQMRFASVGATENLLCAAALANGTTTLVNCAVEPEVVALEQMLHQMGVDLQGIGSSVVTICGPKQLHGTIFSAIPDRIVACTYLACVAAAGGELSVTNCNPAHFSSFLQLLQKRFDVKVYQDVVKLRANSVPYDYGCVQTAPFPGFATDVQQILLSLCAMSNSGTSYINERLFENRLQHNAQQLNKMGAKVQVRQNTAKIIGTNLHGAEVSAADLRGGAGLVVAALGAEGKTTIHNIQHTLRGYCNLHSCLRSVGANIELN